MVPKTAEEIESLFETNAWWKRLSDEVDRVYRVKNIPDFVTDESKAAVVECLFEFTEITEEKFAWAENDLTYLEAKQIINNLGPDNTIPDRIYDLYKEQIPKSLNQIDAVAKNLVMSIDNPDLRSDIGRRWSEDAPIPIQELRNRYNIDVVEQRYLIRKISDLIDKKKAVSRLNSPFDGYALLNVRAEGSQRERCEYLAYRVYDPLWIGGLYEYEPEYVSFPLSWAGSFFSTAVMKRLYNAHKNGVDVLTSLHGKFQNQEELNEIENSIRSCPITERHGDLLAETLIAYKNGSYKLVSRALLSLLEGIIWDFAWWWNSQNALIFDKSVSMEDFRNLRFRFRNHQGLEIKTTPSIGLLLRNTKFGETFSFEFIEYYCEELFRERNPALHGRDSDFGDEKKASILLLCLKVLEKNIFETVSASFAELCISTYEEAKAVGAAQ